MALKYIFTVFFLFFALLNPVAPRAEQIFFSALQDVPIMSGLEELIDQTISFDKPEGRIIESLAVMHDITQRQLLDFYELTLPQFGWGMVDSNLFFRKNEFLEINFEENNNNHLVRIMIKPTL